MSKVFDFRSFGSLNFGETNSPVYYLFNCVSDGENIRFYLGCGYYPFELRELFSSKSNLNSFI